MKALTADEAAAKIGCSAWFLRKQARDQRVPVIRFGPRMIFDEDDIPAIVASFKIPAKVAT